MSEFEVSVASESEGRVRLAERGEQREDGGFDSVELLEQLNDVNVDLSFDGEDAGRITLGLSCHHVESGTGGRAYHANIEAFLTREDAIKLNAAFGFLLASIVPTKKTSA